MTDKIRNIALIVVFIFISFFIYNYYSIKQENKELKLNIEEVNLELDKAIAVNKNNSLIYDKEIERLQSQIKKIDDINKNYDEQNSQIKEKIESIDTKIKDKTIIEKNKILNQELNNVINAINEK